MKKIYNYNGQKLTMINSYLNPYHGLTYFQYRNEQGHIIDLSSEEKITWQYQK
jgi:hypothetical protein